MTTKTLRELALAAKPVPIGNMTSRIPIPNMNVVQAENRRLNDLVNHQLSMMTSMREDLNIVIRQRDEYASLWMNAKEANHE